MAANNRGNMRPANRSPPFLAIGLFVALVILGFNYWNLSVKNGEQFNEISVMERELKLVSAKKTAIEKRAEAIQDKVKYLEDELNKQKGVAGEKASALATAQNERDTIAQAKDELQTEYNILKEKTPLCEKEVTELKEALQVANDELEQKKNEQPQTQTCGESECANYIAVSRDKTLEDIVRVAGSAPLVNLYKDNGNVGKFAETVRRFVANQSPGQLPAQQLAQQQLQQQAQQPEQPMQQPEQPGQQPEQPVQQPEQPVQQPIQPAQQPFQPGQPIVGQPQQLGQFDAVGNAGNQQQLPAEEVKQDAPKAPETYQPVNMVLNQQQPAAIDQQPQVPQPQVPAPVLGDDKHTETGNLPNQNPEEKKDEKEVIDTQGDANKIKSTMGDDKTDADKAEADDADELDADLEDDDDNGAIPPADKKPADDTKISIGGVDKVGNDDDADYDDDADVADRLKIDEKDKAADEYEYEENDNADKGANDNQNEYDDGDVDENYDDDNADDANKDKDDGVEEMRMQLEKDKTI